MVSGPGFEVVLFAVATASARLPGPLAFVFVTVIGALGVIAWLTAGAASAAPIATPVPSATRALFRPACLRRSSRRRCCRFVIVQPSQVPVERSDPMNAACASEIL